MFISQPIDIASNPSIVRVGSEAVDSHHANENMTQYTDTILEATIWICVLHKRSRLTAVTWGTIQKLESKSDRRLRSLSIPLEL